MNDFNWVHARAKCSLAKVFDQLRLEVEEDVKSRDELRTEDHFSGKGYSHAFHCSGTSTQFAVTLVSYDAKHSVIFALKKDAIEILDENNKTLFRVTVTLNNEQRCIAKVDGQEMEFWQVRHKALESLFFESGMSFNIPA